MHTDVISIEMVKIYSELYQKNITNSLALIDSIGGEKLVIFYEKTAKEREEKVLNLANILLKDVTININKLTEYLFNWPLRNTDCYEYKALLKLVLSLNKISSILSGIQQRCLAKIILDNKERAEINLCARETIEDFKNKLNIFNQYDDNDAGLLTWVKVVRNKIAPPPVELTCWSVLSRVNTCELWLASFPTGVFGLYNFIDKNLTTHEFKKAVALIAKSSQPEVKAHLNRLMPVRSIMLLSAKGGQYILIVRLNESDIALIDVLDAEFVRTLLLQNFENNSLYIQSLMGVYSVPRNLTFKVIYEAAYGLELNTKPTFNTPTKSSTTVAFFCYLSRIMAALLKRPINQFMMFDKAEYSDAYLLGSPMQPAHKVELQQLIQALKTDTLNGVGDSKKVVVANTTMLLKDELLNRMKVSSKLRSVLTTLQKKDSDQYSIKHIQSAGFHHKSPEKQVVISYHKTEIGTGEKRNKTFTVDIEQSLIHSSCLPVVVFDSRDKARHKRLHELAAMGDDYELMVFSQYLCAIHEHCERYNKKYYRSVPSNQLAAAKNAMARHLKQNPYAVLFDIAGRKKKPEWTAYLKTLDVVLQATKNNISDIVQQISAACAHQQITPMAILRRLHDQAVIICSAASKPLDVLTSTEWVGVHLYKDGQLIALNDQVLLDADYLSIHHYTDDKVMHPYCYFDGYEDKAELIKFIEHAEWRAHLTALKNNKLEPMDASRILRHYESIIEEDLYLNQSNSGNAYISYFAPKTIEKDDYGRYFILGTFVPEVANLLAKISDESTFNDRLNELNSYRFKHSKNVELLNLIRQNTENSEMFINVRVPFHKIWKSIEKTSYLFLNESTSRFYLNQADVVSSH